VEDLLPMEIENINFINKVNIRCTAEPKADSRPRNAKLDVDYKAYFSVKDLWVDVSTDALYQIRHNRPYFSPLPDTKYPQNALLKASNDDNNSDTEQEDDDEGSSKGDSDYNVNADNDNVIQSGSDSDDEKEESDG
jgi:hypothetical protein